MLGRKGKILQVQVNIRRRDIAAFNLFLMPRARANLVFLAVVTAGMFIFIATQQPSLTPLNLAIALVSSLIGGASALVLGLLFSLVFVLFASNTKSGVLGSHTYSIDPDGLREVTPVNEGFQKWTGVQEVGRSKRFLYVRINGYLFHLIPRHAFGSDQEFSEFSETARKFWKSAA